MKLVIQHVSDRNIDDRIMEFEGDVLRLGRASDQDIRIDQPELPYPSVRSGKREGSLSSP